MGERYGVSFPISGYVDFLGAIMGETFNRRNTSENSLWLFSRLGWWAL
jgi:hypothetical protein